MLQKIVIQLSQNQTLRTIAQKIFLRFPSLKYKVADILYRPEHKATHEIKNNFLSDVKNEIEQRRGSIA